MWTSPAGGLAREIVRGSPGFASERRASTGPLVSRAALSWNAAAAPSTAIDQRWSAAGSAEARMSTSTVPVGAGSMVIETRGEASGFLGGAAEAEDVTGGAVTGEPVGTGAPTGDPVVTSDSGHFG